MKEVEAGRCIILNYIYIQTTHSHFLSYFNHSVEKKKINKNQDTVGVDPLESNKIHQRKKPSKTKHFNFNSIILSLKHE